MTQCMAQSFIIGHIIFFVFFHFHLDILAGIVVARVFAEIFEGERQDCVRARPDIMDGEL